VPPIIKVYEQHKPVEDESSNGHYRIVIEDNGIGFEQKYAEQIFDIFKRLHIRSEFEGTGIGLALCKKLLKNTMVAFPQKVNHWKVLSLLFHYQ
jgi:light-regulated signal transduction histidine kinase (bacteriophytochrome)